MSEFEEMLYSKQVINEANKQKNVIQEQIDSYKELIGGLLLMQQHLDNQIKDVVDYQKELYKQIIVK